MDIQFCLHPYAIGNYIASYMCKGNKYISKTLDQLKRQMTNLQDQTMRSALVNISNTLLRSQEVSAQEAAFLLIGLPLRFASRTITFINTNKPEDRLVILKPKKEIQDASVTNSKVYTPYMTMQCYENRPKRLSNICLADFVSL